MFQRNKGDGRTGPVHHVALKHGPIHQWGNRVKSWKKRFLIVDTEQLVLYETAQDLHKDNPAVRVPMPDVIGVKTVASVLEDAEKGTEAKPPFQLTPQNQNTFVVSTGGRPYYLQAESEAEVEEWVATICLALELSPAAVVGIKQGFVWKKGAQHHNWKRRWFVLTHDALSYYAKKGSDQPLGVIPLKEVRSVGDAADEMAELTSQRDAFGVATDYRTYVCKCESRTSQDSWIDAVRSVAAIRRILEEKERARAETGNQAQSAASGPKEKERERIMTQVGSMKRLAQHTCTMAALANRVACELVVENIEMRQQLGCVVAALGESFGQAAAAFVASLPLTVRVSGEGAHVLRSLRQTRAATDSRQGNIIATANLVKEAVAQLLVLVKTAVGDELSMSVAAGGPGSGSGSSSGSGSGGVVDAALVDAAIGGSGSGSGGGGDDGDKDGGSGSGPGSGSSANAAASLGQAILRDIVITARQLKANTDAVITSQQSMKGVRGGDDDGAGGSYGRTPQEEIVEIAKEAASATQLVANAINGTGAQLVQAAKLASGLVQQLIKCAVDVAKNIRNPALRELIVEAHSSVRDGTIRMVQLARDSAKASGGGSTPNTRQLSTGLTNSSSTLTRAINNLVALAGVAAQHHIAEDQLRSGKGVVKKCMDTLQSVSADGALVSVLDDAQVAKKLLDGCKQYVIGIELLMSTITGEEKKASASASASDGDKDTEADADAVFGSSSLSKSISVLSQAVFLLVTTATDVAEGLSDTDLRSHLNRAVNSVKDLTVQLHTVIKNALNDEQSYSLPSSASGGSDVERSGSGSGSGSRSGSGSKVSYELPTTTQKASRSCSHVLQVASVCKSLSNGYANLLDSTAYVGTKDYRHAAEYEAVNDVDIWEVEQGKCVIYSSSDDKSGGGGGGGGPNAEAAETATPAPASVSVSVPVPVPHPVAEESDRDRPIRAASLNQLVIRLTSEHAVDLKFQKTILTTYRSFTTPYQLFQKLVQRYQVPVPGNVGEFDLDHFSKSIRLPIQLRVCNVIAQWIESSYHDFNDELHSKMERFIEKNVKPNHAALAVKLGKSLARKKAEADAEAEAAAAAEKEKEKEADAHAAAQAEAEGGNGNGDGDGDGQVRSNSGSSSESDPARPPGVSLAMTQSAANQPAPAATAVATATAPPPSVSLVQFDTDGDRDGILRSMTLAASAALRPFGPMTTSRRAFHDVTSPADVLEKVEEEYIATQLTLIEWDIYHRIEPVELLRQAWNKEKLKHLSPNVTVMISRFNLLSSWVSSTILWQEKLKQRAKVMSKWVMIADALKRLNNFNSLLAILSGLNSSGVYRLKYTKEELGKKAQGFLREMEELMDNKNSYKNYRQYLHNVNPPCTPYLGVYLTDLTFIEDGNPDEIEGLINYKKRELVYNVIQEVKQYQQARYSDIYDSSTQIQGLLNQMHGADENELYELSLLREPRGASAEDIA